MYVPCLSFTDRILWGLWWKLPQKRGLNCGPLLSVAGNPLYQVPIIWSWTHQLPSLLVLGQYGCMDSCNAVVEWLCICPYHSFFLVTSSTVLVVIQVVCLCGRWHSQGFECGEGPIWIQSFWRGSYSCTNVKHQDHLAAFECVCVCWSCFRTPRSCYNDVAKVCDFAISF